MTVKERLQQVVAELSDEEAEVALALLEDARAGATPVDVYGSAWESVLEGVDPRLLEVSGTPTIVLPEGLPDIR